MVDGAIGAVAALGREHRLAPAHEAELVRRALRRDPATLIIARRCALLHSEQCNFPPEQ